MSRDICGHRMSTSEKHLYIPDLHIRKYKDFMFLLELNIQKITEKALPDVDIQKLCHVTFVVTGCQHLEGT